MNLLKNMTRLPMEMAVKLAENEKLQKLILNDTPSALSSTIKPKTVNELIKEEKIIFHQLANEGIDNNNNNSLIILYIDSINKTEEGLIYGSVLVYAITDQDHFLLENNKLRLLEISNQIIESLDGVKFSSAGTLNFQDLEYISLSPFKFSNVLRFDIFDERRKVEI